MHGQGIWEYLGSIYEGDIVCDIKQGQGTMQYSNGQIYVGEWSNNKPSMLAWSGDYGAY